MRIFLLIVVIVTFKEIKCYVTDRIKFEYSDVTQMNHENISEIRHEDASEKKYEYDKKVQDDSSVYLDDVLFTLKNQKWSDDEKPCLDEIYRLLYSLQNFTLWAVWDWDALSSEPQGLLFGNKYQLGNFDQCMETPWSTTYPELSTKYCLAEIVLQRTDSAVRHRVEQPIDPYHSALDFMQYRPPQSRPLNELTWGACVPSTCQSRTVERLLAVMISRSHLGAARMQTDIVINEECQTTEQREYDSLFYAFFIVMGSLTLISITCTYLNCRQGELDSTKKNSIIKAFCLKENSLDLLKVNKNGVEVLYGIRYLTICLIVLDHQIGMFNSGPISNGLTTDQYVISAVGLLIIHDDLFVDTFFMLSGFLTVTTLAKFKRLPNPLLLIFKRYIRLIVGLAVMIFYVSGVFAYTGTGPLWNRAVAHDTVQCRKNWWLNILMISNYVDTENICIVTSWYIPCDFHYFVVTVSGYYLYKKNPIFGVAVAAVLTTAALVVPGVINYYYQRSPILLFTVEFVLDPRSSTDFHLSYIKSHTRYGAYLVGFISGYIFDKYSANGHMKRIKQNWSILGTCTAITLMLVVMLFGSTFVWRSYNPLEAAMYAALNRPAWAAGVALLVLSCSFGHVPLIKSFLSWYPWVPLSRLAYGLYLTHGILITRNVFITRNPQHNDFFDILTAAAGVIFWGTLAAYVLWLLAEAPANNLLTLCMKSNLNKVTPTTQSKQVNVIATPSTSGNTRYLNENLPTKIQYSSKM